MGEQTATTSGWVNVPHASIYWESTGEPSGIPVLYLHGGPGGSLGKGGYRKRHDQTRFRIIGLDQRGCGKSTPTVQEDLVHLSENTTQALIEDIEAVREHLGIQKWIVTGVSWGSTLALAYALKHPGRVLGIALVAVTTRLPYPRPARHQRPGCHRLAVAAAMAIKPPCSHRGRGARRPFIHGGIVRCSRGYCRNDLKRLSLRTMPQKEGHRHRTMPSSEASLLPSRERHPTAALTRTGQSCLAGINSTLAAGRQPGRTVPTAERPSDANEIRERI